MIFFQSEKSFRKLRFVCFVSCCFRPVLSTVTAKTTVFSTKISPKNGKFLRFTFGILTISPPKITKYRYLVVPLISKPLGTSKTNSLPILRTNRAKKVRNAACKPWASYQAVLAPLIVSGANTGFSSWIVLK